MVLTNLALASFAAANAIITLCNRFLINTATILALDTTEMVVISLKHPERRNLGRGIHLFYVQGLAAVFRGRHNWFVYWGIEKTVALSLEVNFNVFLNFLNIFEVDYGSIVHRVAEFLLERSFARFYRLTRRVVKGHLVLERLSHVGVVDVHWQLAEIIVHDVTDFLDFRANNNFVSFKLTYYY